LPPVKLVPGPDHLYWPWPGSNRPDRSRLRATFSPDFSPDWGTKNLSADLITFNSASQTFVNSQRFYSSCAGCQRLYLPFFAAVAHSQLPSIYRYPGSCQKLFSTIFHRQPHRFYKERGGDNILNQNSRKCFLYFFCTIFQGLNPQRIRPQETDRENGRGGKQFREDPAV